MNMKRNSNWSREEIVLAYELYCRIPFEQISKNKREIINLATKINRTPSAVALKLFNLAHFDKYHISRNIKAMSNGSKLDKEVFFEFENNKKSLIDEALKIKEKMWLEERDEYFVEDNFPEGCSLKSIVKKRVGQTYFREIVLSSYNYKCCITGLSAINLLEASHIKPWSASDDKSEKLNPSNGLCLCSFLHSAFDKGLISIDFSYKILLSSHLGDIHLDQSTKEWLYSYKGRQIYLPYRCLPGIDFIQYHNNMVFRY